VVTEQYRAALQYINSLWKEGVIDPEIYLLNQDQARQKMVNSVSGSVVSQWWSLPQIIHANGLAKLTPSADYTPLLLTSNDGKISGSPDNGIVSHTNSIANTSKNPEKVMDFLDYLHTNEGWYLAVMGFEGTDYNMINGFHIKTETGLAKSSTMTLDPLYSLSNRIWLFNPPGAPSREDRLEELTHQWSLMQQSVTPLYTSAFYGLPNPKANAEYGVDVNNWIEQSSMSFITGETPINDANWNTYINTWKRMGGVKILQGYLDAYNSLNGTKITAGITE
jgi:putative aldouronate transport system substrate-binding protein